jgi:preprotein translocase subunit SecD
MRLLNKITVIMLVVLLMALALDMAALKKAKTENKRLRENESALFEKVNYYRTQYGLNAAGVARITIERDQLEAVNAQLAQKIESLDIKLRRVVATSETAVATQYRPQVQIRDSIVFINNQQPDSLTCLQYTDPWVTVSGCFTAADTSFVPLIETRDTISQIIHRVPKKFLFIKYGAKAIRQEMVFSNPWSRPVFTQYIEFK